MGYLSTGSQLGAGGELTAAEEDWVQTGAAGVLELAEGTAPTNEAGKGKIYVKSSDSKLYYQDDSGSEIVIGITSTIVDTSGTPVANDIARFTDANTIEGRSYAELKADLDLEIGTDVQAQGDVLDDLNALGANSADSEFLVGTGAGALAWESGATARASLGLGSAAVVATDLADLNEATIEAAIDTLANLTSVQGLTVTLADAGANAIFGWDDAAGAYENLTQAEASAIIDHDQTANFTADEHFTQGNIVATGALDSGSITSNFGTIDTGSSTITTTGDITGGGIHVTGDTSAGDNAALGYTATEGLILTGQGSTNDVTFKNDADATVFAIPTGTTDVKFGVDGTATNLILAEKTSVQLDPAGGADGDYSGITFTGTAGETFAFGDVVYLKAADSEWYLADADAVGTAGTVAIAIAVSAGSDGASCTLMSHGIIRADAAFPTLTISAPVYISTTGTTTNTVTNTAPSGADDVVRVVGFGLTANEMIFNPSPDHITVTG